ncbi:type III-B CRISPR module RAMP protein Cmr4 [Deferribacterales bacterium Es71-Z0220]|jgi:CRISPR-associated protein Cmr4|uniref:type III-B CRISPR module RAMP protein Cmr4 n=1 Tax=Deferrivibrio essentukiensis TaxID=2880922 RepID=UPI001F602FA5|nr:type III-B CRISPR module RAMP protein Cmr4 [Deferrivibrio essentukiensis]MCB4204625.1 type III-B CRISPR module RAMP protein Cmr4 [Deferrivibrio essentukiensis]
MLKYHLFTIRTLSNMHVGSGDTNFGVVDNLIQRDPTTNYPYISSSSLKGALREHCESNGLDSVSKIFGKEAKNNNESAPGSYKFFPAYILSIPVRSDIRAYFNGTCPNICSSFKKILDDFSINYKFNYNIPKPEKVEICENNKMGTVEGYEVKYNNDISDKNFKDLFGAYPAIFPDEIFLNDVALNMPVVARNKLENGRSENLWYEEVVPRESRFYFIVGAPENDSDFNAFVESITKSPVQIGANASIGYGFSLISLVSEV